MAILVDCPNCGPRSVEGFVYEGEVRSTASKAADSSPSAWFGSVYERTNIDGLASEWWFHQMGCHQWFLADRNTLTNEVVETRFPLGRGG